MIYPTGEDRTMTRKALLALREKDAARLKAKWKTQKEALKTKEEILAAEGAG